MSRVIASKLRDLVRALGGVRLAWAASPALLGGNVVLTVAQGVLPFAALWFAAKAVDAVAVASTRPAVASAFPEVLSWILAAGGVAVALAVVSSLAAVASESLALSVSDHVADMLHAKSVAVDLAFYEDPSFHDTLHRAQQDAAYRPARVVSGLLQLLQNLSGLMAAGLLLAALRWWMAAALAFAACPGLLAKLRFSERLFEWSREATAAERRAWYHHWLLTAPEAAAEQRALGIGDLFHARYAALKQRLRDGRAALGRRRATGEAVAQGLGAAVVFAIFAFLAREAVAGAISVGAFVLHFQAFQRGLSALNGVLGGMSALLENGLFLRWMDEFLTLVPGIEDPPVPRPAPRPVKQGLSVTDVSFRYRASAELALDGVSFRMAPGEVLALVGPNGSGKTTLIKLLLRLYDPGTGSIAIDGVDLRDMAVLEVRRCFSVLLQGFGRYAFTARENVRLGDVSMADDDPRLFAAAETSGAAEEVRRLPRGWETVLGTWFDDGRELSAGQWQKLALARALAREAPFVVLDEPSAALDPLSEQHAFESLRRLIAGRSALVISHHLSVARRADRILVFERGRLVEQGPHEELLRSRGTYARMWEAAGWPAA